MREPVTSLPPRSKVRAKEASNAVHAVLSVLLPDSQITHTTEDWSVIETKVELKDGCTLDLPALFATFGQQQPTPVDVVPGEPTQLDRIEAMMRIMLKALAEEAEQEQDEAPAQDLDGNSYGGARDQTQSLG